MTAAEEQKICFIAPSTFLLPDDKFHLDRTIRLFSRVIGASNIYLSPFLFRSSGSISHVTATALGTAGRGSHRTCRLQDC